MPTETIVAVFETAAKAESAVSALVAAGVPASSIQHFTKESGSAATGDLVSQDNSEHRPGGFWAWLTGEEMGDSGYVNHRALYDRSIESGGTVVTVVTDASASEKILSILDQHSPSDVEERAAQYETTGTPPDIGTPATSDGAAMTGNSPRSGVAGTSATTGTEEVLSLAAESLQVGKREVEGGTTRIRRYVVERPVEEQVRLRDEHVRVFRRPVSGTGAVGTAAFTDKTIEVRERSEEAVISKTAQIVEEVVVQKGVEERVETVRDTVRQEQVEIEGPTGVSGAKDVSSMTGGIATSR